MLPISPSTSLKRSTSTPNTLSALRTNCSIEDDPYSDSRTKPLILGQKHGQITSSTNKIFNNATPEELAKQLTLIDWSIFSRITRKELKPGQWTGPTKHVLSPNVVAFTRRFNILTYWISDEILSLNTPKKRAEILGYFLRVCTYLIEIKSLYSAFAIFCTLTSEPIHRLHKTWEILSKKEKLSFEKISFLFNQAENSCTLRNFMDKALESMPANCIPNFSIFLRDIILIDSFYSSSDPGRIEERNKKLDMIYSFIQKCQQSNFDHIHLIEDIYDYLNSFNYIEELQKFREDDYYNLSIKLEPPEDKIAEGQSNTNKSKFYRVDGKFLFNSNYDICNSVSSSSVAVSSSKQRLYPFLEDLKLDHLNKSLNETLFQDNSAKDKKAFKPGHRKTNSLEMGALNVPKSSLTLPKQSCTTFTAKTLDYNLIDDSPAFDVFASHLHHENQYSRKPHLEVVQQNHHEDDDSSIDDDPRIKNYYSERDFLCCGPISRKTILKIGKKPSLPFWTNFYLGLTNESLLFFNIKQAGTSKLKPLKRFYLLDWTVAHVEDGPGNDKCNIFTLADRNCSTVYKIRCGNEIITKEWVQIIRKVTSNLKSFYI